MKRIKLYKIILWGLAFSVASCESQQNSSEKISPPVDQERIIPMMSGGIQDDYKGLETLGFKKGDQLPDFTIFNLEGVGLNLFEELENGKPLMLVTGSYTCAITRGNLPKINELSQLYANEMETFMVYIIDAHPYDTISPYSADNEIWVTEVNEKLNVRATQPKTYGERRDLAKKWKEQYNVQTNVLVDDPDNKFWKAFGEAPNTVYLVQPNGKVFFKQVFFEKEELEPQIQLLIGK